MKIFLAFLLLSLGFISNAQTIKIIEQQIPTKASFRGLSAVNEQIAWASGSGGTVLKTINGGETWVDVSVPEADSIQFRDIEAFDKNTAIIMGVASPAKFYKTIDGGATWKEVYSNSHPGIFFDAMDFWDTQNGIAFGDAIDEHLVIITTTDGGISWQEINYSTLPKSPEGEGGFAASGTCLTTFGESTVWIGLGSPASRMFKSEDKGHMWTVVETPMKRPNATASAGIFSLAFTSPAYGIAVGGDYEDDKDRNLNAAITTNGGKTWNVLSENQPNGYRSVVAHVPNTEWWIAAGTSGVDVSKDNGKTWEAVSKEGFHTASFGNSKVGWLSGGGKIWKIVIN
ncbi:MAG: oxidoreductase [Cyclobacteriaceae bacterium]|nr:oxidoreductase [Cyclobacteriaceae bacterium]